MLSFIINYWIAVMPPVVTGLILIAAAKRLRDERARQEKALALLTIRRQQQG